jgi:transposase
VNVLKPHMRVTIETLLRAGVSRREIERKVGVDRKTIRRYAEQLSKSPGVATGSGGEKGQNPPPRPPAFHRQSVSECAPHREWIEAQIALGRNAVSIHQDLTESHSFTSCYNSVKRFVSKLKARDPERFDVLEFPPGEEAQVDLGEGALTLHKSGKYRRPWLFVMTLKYSGKSFRKTAWKMDQETWALLHEEAFQSCGGVVQYVVLDNLKQGVITPDIYEPELNAVYATMLAHYGAVADPCRVGDPNRKGTVESAIQHTQGTALKGRRFETIEAQNRWLEHWEENWAALRIHGRKKRQVLEMFREEVPHLRPLAAERFRIFKQVERTVDDAGLVQVNGSYYSALPAAPHSTVTVRIYEREIEIMDALGQSLRRHEKSARKGSFTMEASDRIFNPSRETARLLRKALLIGSHTLRFAEELFSRGGRPAQKALYGLTNLARTYERAHIDAACERLLAAGCLSYAAVKRVLERQKQLGPKDKSPTLIQSDPLIRSVEAYREFWDAHTNYLQTLNTTENTNNANVDR